MQIELGNANRVTRARFLFIAQVQIELESDVVELGELQIFRGGVGGSDSCKGDKNVSTRKFFFLFFKDFFQYSKPLVK